jgi:hypothetical protein
VGIPGTGLSYTETSGGSSRSPQENSGCGGCLGQIILLILVLGGISMCVNSGKDSSTDMKSTTSPTPQASAAQTPKPTPASTSTPSPFPESRYWPKKIRLLKPVEFTGSVSGGPVRSTVSAGTVLPASLSADHQSVEVRMNDLTATISLSDTDFLKRANLKKSRAEN